MTIDQKAQQDFESAFSRAFWRKVMARLTGASNDLLPFDEVRQQLPIRGQHYIGLQQVEIEKIVGSLGRYRDFDRAFLPIQTQTKQRWISIDKAHYTQAPLPPVDLFKIGDVYFVKDGNHRISVASERGQTFIDAYVIEVDIPVKLSANLTMDELAGKREAAEFLLQTGLSQLAEGEIDAITPGLGAVLLEHIAVHRWYLGVERGAEVGYAEAAASWYNHVYQPLVDDIRQQELVRLFAGPSETDLYVWVMEYQGYLRQAYAGEGDPNSDSQEPPRAQAARQLVEDYPLPAVRHLISILSRTRWLDEILLRQEQAAFQENTHLPELRPQSDVRLTLPGQYARLLEHIAVHRWYLGEQRRADVAYPEAVISWYDYVYLPLVEIIREQDILKEFPNRAEADLYLWIIQHQWYLRQMLGEVPIQKAAEQFAEDFSERTSKKIRKVFRKPRQK